MRRAAASLLPEPALKFQSQQIYIDINKCQELTYLIDELAVLN